MSESKPAAATLQHIPSIAAGYRLQFEQAQDSWVLLYPEGMVKLNPSAAEILQRCDGSTSLQAILSDIEAAFSATDLQNDVLSFVDIAVEQRWLELRLA